MKKTIYLLVNLSFIANASHSPKLKQVTTSGPLSTTLVMVNQRNQSRSQSLNQSTAAASATNDQKRYNERVLAWPTNHTRQLGLGPGNFAQKPFSFLPGEVTKIVLDYAKEQLKLMREFQAHPYGVRRLMRFNSQRFVSVGLNTISLCSKDKVLPIQSFTNSWKVDCITYLDNDHFLTGDILGNVTLWQKNQAKPKKMYPRESRPGYDHRAHGVIDIAVLNSNQFVALDEDDSCRLFDKNNTKVQKEMYMYNPYGLIVLDENTFVTGAAFIRLWHKDSSEIEKQFKITTPDHVRYIASLDAQHFIVAGSFGKLFKFHRDHEQPQIEYEGHQFNATNVAQILYSNIRSIAALDTNFFVTGAENGTIKLWHKDQVQSVRDFKVPQKSEIHYLLKLKENHFISINKNGDLNVWHKEQEECLATIPADVNSRISCALVLDSTYFVTGHSDGSTKLWGWEDESGLVEKYFIQYLKKPKEPEVVPSGCCLIM